MRILILLFFLTTLTFFSCNVAYGQAIQLPRDSAKIYREFEQISKKGKVYKFMYSIIFKPLAVKPTNSKQKSKKPKQKIVGFYEGKIIRSIQFQSLDPFGYVINDTSVIPHGYITSMGNKLHIKTRAITLKNLVLIKTNEPFDSLYVKESERLIRSQLYVRDVLFDFHTTKNQPDSVDIVVRVLDNWSISAGLGLNLSKPGFNLKDQNFIGLGHTFQPSFSYNTQVSKPTFALDYTIPNYRNTFITAHGYFNLNEDNSFTRFISIERLFYTSLAKWAGGVSLRQQLRKDSISYPHSLPILQPFKQVTQEIWMAKAWRVFKESPNLNRISNVVVSTRFLRNNFQQRPGPLFDTLHIYTTQQNYYIGLGISTQRYIQDKYIFNYGVFEDVPVGSVYGLIAGYQIQNNTKRLYTGMKVSWGDYNNWGYFSTSLEYGNFFHEKHIEQGTISVSASYFTALFQWGGWKFRQFIKPQVIFGINRFATDTLSIMNEIRPGEDVGKILGQHKIVLTFQTQSYAPVNILGFRLGPFLVATLATLATEKSGFRNSRIYSLIGVGVLIKNEFLIMNNFEIALSFFPRIHGVDSQKFKINSYKPSDYGFRSFDFSKPQEVAYK